MLKNIHITEKSSNLNSFNCYTFIIDNFINKIQLKSYLENKFSVKVTKVNILNIKPKKIRRGRITGKTNLKKKAYVFTKEPIESLLGEGQ